MHLEAEFVPLVYAVEMTNLLGLARYSPAGINYDGGDDVSTSP